MLLICSQIQPKKMLVHWLVQLQKCFEINFTEGRKLLLFYYIFVGIFQIVFINNQILALMKMVISPWMKHLLDETPMISPWVTVDIYQHQQFPRSFPLSTKIGVSRLIKLVKWFSVDLRGKRTTNQTKTNQKIQKKPKQKRYVFPDTDV